MEERDSVFKVAAVPGLIISLIYVGLSLVLWTIISDIKLQGQLAYVIWLVIAFLFFFYTKNYRDNNLNGNITYGESFKFIFVMSLVLSVFAALYSYILIGYLDPSITEKSLEAAAEALYAQNLDEDQIEAGLKMQSIFMTPGILSVFAFGWTIFVGLVFSLIISIFTKKEINSFEEE